MGFYHLCFLVVLCLMDVTIGLRYGVCRRVGRRLHCCTDFQLVEDICLPCIGSYGDNCTGGPCVAGFYGHGCRTRCNCTTQQQCDRTEGCVNQTQDVSRYPTIVTQNSSTTRTKMPGLDMNMCMHTESNFSGSRLSSLLEDIKHLKQQKSMWFIIGIAASSAVGIGFVVMTVFIIKICIKIRPLNGSHEYITDCYIQNTYDDLVEELSNYAELP